MNTQENKIPLLQEVLDEYEAGTLDMKQSARKCYMSEMERYLNRVAWIHNDELQKHIILRNMSKGNTRDLLRNKKLM